MIQRTTNPKHPAWPYYGGRGITACKAWQSFDAFYKDMGEPPVGHWIDRIDNEKGYGPDNCRWVTPKESAKNRRARKPVNPTSLRQRAIASGLPYHVVYQRVAWGWPVELALSTPKGKPGGTLKHLRNRRTVDERQTIGRQFWS